MALEGTHLRFARDLTHRYRVSDASAYFAGAIYPDSRYVTNIKRRLTHPDDFLAWDLERADDFKKGWHTHLLCDKLQSETLKKWLPDLFIGDTEPRGEVWVRHTALKILRDIDDVKRFDISAILPCLDYAENPNQEPMETLKRYNRFFQEIYANPATVTIESCFRLWLKLGVDEYLALRVKGQAEVFQQDERVTTHLARVYPAIMQKTDTIKIP